MGTVYFPDQHTAEEWEEMARDCYRREQESFERSDTDGFMSQWAAQVSAQLYRTLADVARHGGRWTFRVLADREGNEIEGARQVKSPYGGMSWLIPGTGFFNPSHDRDDARRAAKDLAKGYQFIEVEKDAVVIMMETGGIWRVSPVIMPKRKREE